MDLLNALAWRPPDDWMRVSVVEAHTGGEPFRVIIDGLPEIPGATVLAKRRYAQENFDGLRRALIWEPRGHTDMYGGWPGPPTSADGHLSVLFLHNEGFSTMCGHGIIALSKVVLDTGILPASTPETMLRIDTPAGQVEATSLMKGGQVVSTRFRNVSSFVVGLDQIVDVPAIGEVTYDLAFGGAFYAVVDASSLGLALQDVTGLIEAGRSIKRQIASLRPISHPEADDLGFLYGIIFTGPAGDPVNHSRNVCVFADGEVDRSPTGTGVSSRLAILHERGELSRGDSVTIESIVGSTFTGRIVDSTTVGQHSAVIPEIEGSAQITGRAELWIDPDDSLGKGFLVR